MLLPIPEEVLQAQARDRTLDAVLGGLGVSAAIASASFAAYMIAVGPAHGPAARGNALMAFAGSPSHAPRTAAVPAEPDPASSTPDAIDFDPTGSIAALPDGAETPADAQAVLPDFAVRDAFDGTALVEAHGTLQMVQPGSVLAGAGKVLSIARRDKGWVVATSGGTILQRR